MKITTNFIYYPGGENESKAANTDQNAAVNPEKNPSEKIENEEHKSIAEKIKEALQDWSNKDELDQEFDDTRV